MRRRSTSIGGGGADRRAGAGACCAESFLACPVDELACGCAGWSFAVGSSAQPTSSEGSWSARIAVQEGSALDESLGVWTGRGHTGYPIASLARDFWRRLLVWGLLDDFCYL